MLKGNSLLKYNASRKFQPAAVTRRKEAIFLVLIIALALFLRVYGAVRLEYIEDEEHWIALAKSVSFEKGKIHLPVKGDDSHPFLMIYLIKFFSLILGESRLGFRMANILLGTATVAAVYFLCREGLGQIEGFIAAGFLALSRFHIGISRFATEKGNLFFVALGFYLLWRGFVTEKKRFFFLAGLIGGLGCLTRETTVLMVPIAWLFVLSLVPDSKWFKHPGVYIFTFFAIIFSLLDMYFTSWVDTYAKTIFHFPSLEPCPLYFLYGEVIGWLTPEILPEVQISWQYPGVFWMHGILITFGVVYVCRKWDNLFLRLMLVGFIFVFIFTATTCYPDAWEFWYSAIIIIVGTVVAAAFVGDLLRRGVIFKIFVALFFAFIFIRTLFFIQIDENFYWPSYPQAYQEYLSEQGENEK